MQLKKKLFILIVMGWVGINSYAQDVKNNEQLPAQPGQLISEHEDTMQAEPVRDATWWRRQIQRWTALMSEMITRFWRSDKDKKIKPQQWAQITFKASKFATLPADAQYDVFQKYLRKSKTVNDVNDYVAAFALIQDDTAQFVQSKLAQKIIKERKKAIRKKEKVESKKLLQALQTKLDKEFIPVDIVHYGIDAQNPITGKTALIYAVERKLSQLVEDLIEADADISLKDRNGSSAVTKALSLDRDDILKIVLKRAGPQGMKLYVLPYITKRKQLVTQESKTRG